MKPTFRNFDDRTSMTKTLAYEIEKSLCKAASLRASVSFVAAGGSTVPPLYHELRTSDVPWERVTITLSDERWIDQRENGSNFKLVSDELLQENADGARLIPLRGGAHTPEEAVLTAHNEIMEMPLPFDVTLLGMGTDMHAASLFPNAHGIEAGLDLSRANLVCKIGPVESAAGSSMRLSLTLRAILSSRNIFIMITGEAKRNAYETALACDDPIKAPVSAILRQSETPVYVYWAP